MTQGLHFSMLMTGADTALLSDTVSADSGASDAASTDSGMLFGSMLGELVQPEKNRLGAKAARQLPAGISLLSGVSQAIAAATDGDLTEAMLSGAGQDSDLTSSILAQLALNGAAAHSSGEQQQAADTTAGMENASGEAGAELGDIIAAKANAASAGAGTELTADDSRLLAAAAKQLTSAEGDEHKHGTDADTAAKAGLNTTDSSTDDTSLAAKSADNTKATAGALANNTITADGDTTQTNTAKPADVVSATTPPTTVAADASDDITEAEVLQQPRHTAAGNETALPAGEAAPAAGSASASRPVSAGKLASDAAAQNTALQGADLAASASNDTVLSGTLSAELAGQVNSDNKADDKHSALASRVAATMADKTDGTNSNKAAAGDSGAQQQQQRQQGSAALSDMAMEAGAALTNKPNDTSSALHRAESPFAQALQQVEQRQQSNAAKAVRPAVAEQLKQSLNLLQQDSPAQLQQRVNLMLRQNIQVAEIRLDPAGLGQMQIKIDMQQEQASVQFVVQQPQAKELLEQQLPRLRELLQQQGIVLSEGSVQQQSQQQERQLAQHGRSGNQQGGNMDDNTDDIPATAVQVTAAVSERLVDYYA